MAESPQESERRLERTETWRRPGSSGREARKLALMFDERDRVPLKIAVGFLLAGRRMSIALGASLKELLDSLDGVRVRKRVLATLVAQIVREETFAPRPQPTATPTPFAAHAPPIRAFPHPEAFAT